MRKKLDHNLLKGGCSFYYRDIFSGLGSEKMGPALYSFLFNNDRGDQNPSIHNFYSYYTLLLRRYGRRFIPEKFIIDDLVKEVLQDQFALSGLQPSRDLRLILKTDLINRYHLYHHTQLFNRSYLQLPNRNSHINWLKNLYERKPKNPT